MKNSILFSFIFILLFTSCIQKDDSKSHSIENVPNSLIDTIQDLECFSSYQIYHETAYLWQESWVSYFTKDSSEHERYTDSPQLHFDESSLDSLYLEALENIGEEEIPGVLLWYILLNQNDSIPSLALQNTVSCNIDEGGTILVSPLDGSGVFEISQDSLDLYKGYWMSASINNEAVITKTYAYNYSWKSIRSLIDANAAPSGIYISYGLRTIEPHERGYITSPLTNKTGSIVYCNVLYDSNNESDLLSTLEDFALPCPEYCGNNKTFISPK